MFVRPLVLSAAALLLPLAATASGSATVPRLPAAAFVSRPAVTQPRLAPDGKHLAVIMQVPKEGELIPTVVVYRLPDLTPVSTLRLTGFEVPSRFTWISSTRLVISKAFELGTREAPAPTGELVAVNYDTTDARYLYGFRNLELSRRGAQFGRDDGFGAVELVPQSRNNHVIVSVYSWHAKNTQLIDINTLNASRKTLADLPYHDANFVLESDGQPRFAHVLADNADHLVLRYDGAGDKWSRSPGDLSFVPFYVGEDGQSVFGYSGPKGAPESLATQPLAGGPVTVLAAADLGNVDQLEWSSRPYHVFAAGSHVGRPHLQYLETASADARLHADLSAQFPDEYVHFIDFSDDGSKLLFSVRSDRNPGEYYLYDRVAGRADLLFQAQRRIDPALMAERRPLRFAARDGLALTGYLTVPRNLAPGARPPLVLLPHGGPHGIADDWFYDADAQFLANRGYAVLQVNYRGSGGRGEAFLNSGYREWGDKIMNDLADGVRWVAEQKLADGDRVCVYGASFGGYAALMLAAREPALFKCAVGYAGVYDLPLLFEDDDVRSRASLRSVVARYIGTDKAELARISPVNLAATIRAPVLLVHGEADQVAPIEHARRMRAALEKAGHAPAWLAVPKEGHGFYNEAHAAAFYDKLDAFLAQSLGVK
jgi:dipeptidyl aminopeptidase/acylaminoacyl peptidase